MTFPGLPPVPPLSHFPGITAKMTRAAYAEAGRIGIKDQATADAWVYMACADPSLFPNMRLVMADGEGE
jgi:hypothetical protein